MPTTSRAKPNDKFAQSRSEKNSPERVEAAKKRKETPPKSVQAKLDAIAASKKKVSRGPKAVGPRRSADTAVKIRDEERVFNLVHAILRTWKSDSDANHPAAAVGIIKVSRRQVERSLRDLKNTRFTKIPSLINDVLVYNEIFHEFGQWVYVEHDSPDWIFVRLPSNDTEVVRAGLHDKNDDKVISVALTTEQLLPSADEDEEDEIPDNVEYDDEDDTEEEEVE